MGRSKTAPLLQIVLGSRKSFGRTEVLKDVRFSAEAGEIVGLCGENGSGKSTLVKILGGVLAHGSYSGEILLEGKRVSLSGPLDSQQVGIAVVHQRSMLVPELSVAQNVMLGREPRRFGLVDETRLEAEARKLLERFGLAEVLDPSQQVGELSPGLQQIVEILRGLAHDARILVLDEPTASLLPRERERLLAWLRTLKSTGTTCIYVSHRIGRGCSACAIGSPCCVKGAPPKLWSGPHHRAAPGRRSLLDRRHGSASSGGMATVHLGKARGRAILVFRAPSPSSLTLPAARQRSLNSSAMFLDEARLASRVRHPNVVSVLDVLSEAGELCLVMEYVEGESLSVLSRTMREARQPIPNPIAVAVNASILHGLHAAHQATDPLGVPLGLVHRDVSPQNVIVGVDGVSRLIDFGIAKAAGRSSVSRDGQLKGKIPYMAPEQIQCMVVGHRTDIYGAAGDLLGAFGGRSLVRRRDARPRTRGACSTTSYNALSRHSTPWSQPSSTWRPRCAGLSRDGAQRFESARAFALQLEAVIRPAMAAEISEWGAQHRRTALATRSEKLARMERQASALDDAPAPQPSSPLGAA